MSGRLRTTFVLILSLFAATPATGQAQTYDLVLLNGRVMDPETLLDAVRNVGLQDGRIAAITTDALSGRDTVDATGHVIAPGFIDTHFHALDGLTVRLGALDGVTTGMDLELGAYDIDAWYAAKSGHWPLNYGTTVSQEMARMAVHDSEMELAGPADATRAFELRAASGRDGVTGWAATPSSLEQMNRVTALLDEGLRQGALGVGSTVGYARGGITSYEMFEAQRAAARYGRLTSVHTRYHGDRRPPTEGPLAFDEAFSNAVALSAPLVVAHNNDYGWWEIEEKLELARAQGHVMWSDYYPYEAGSTSIGAEFLRPEVFEDQRGMVYGETLYDPERDRFLTKAEYLETVAQDPGRIIVVFFPDRDVWMPQWLRTPHMTVGSDAMWAPGRSWDDDYSDYTGHPRTAGTRGTILRLGREQGVPLMFALSQLSYWPAKHLGDAGITAMRERGRVQVGMVADLTVFDAGTVTDNATYRAGEHGRPTSGIPYVIVSGRLVVKDGEFQHGVWAGQPIRYPVEAEGRFVPVTAAQLGRGS